MFAKREMIRVMVSSGSILVVVDIKYGSVLVVYIVVLYSGSILVVVGMIRVTISGYILDIAGRCCYT